MNKPISNLIERSLSKKRWEPHSVGGLTLLRSGLLSRIPGFEHAFTTRIGGDSLPPLDSFNLGRHWDTEESRLDAMKNRQRLCEVLDLDFARLAVPGQKHTTNIHWIASAEDFAEGPLHFSAIDAMATNRKGQPLLLHYADCVPIILVDTHKQAICVVHAGWRGTAGSIVKKAVASLVARVASDPAHLLAAIGPSVGSCCFETGEDVAAALLPTVSHADGLVCRKGRPYPDLKAFNALQLLESGVVEVDVSDWCTACNPELFYSHRQSSGKTGRQGAIACLLP